MAGNHTPCDERQCTENVENGSNKLLQSLESRYFIVDIGANLTNKKFARDIDPVVQRAKDAGIQKIIVTGTSLQSSKDALRLTRLYPGTLYCTAGLHPHDAKSWCQGETDDSLRELASNPECVAIGECGLDFNRNFSPPDIQIQVFEYQVQLACALRKPLFIHEREAHDALVLVLKRYKDQLPAVVIHCFTGNKAEVQSYLDLGCYIGLTGYLWKDKSEDGVRKILEDGLLPLDRILVETDAPFMYPNTKVKLKEACLTQTSLNFVHRYCTFQRNEPCSLPVTVEMIAAHLKLKPEDVAMKTTFTALKVFGLQ